MLLKPFLSDQNVREWTYNFQHFGLEDGLPSTEVYHVMQDRNLNLWFCTDRGIVKYDGHEFKSYNKSHRLPDLTIFKSFEDEKGRIWFSSFSHELSYFENDSIYLFERNEELVNLWNKLTFKNLSPHDFFIRNDTIFVGIQKQQMLIVPPNSPVSEYRPNQLPKHINYIEVDTSGHSFGQYRWVPDHK